VKRSLLILCLVCLGVLHVEDAKADLAVSCSDSVNSTVSMTVSCGDWVQISAIPDYGYHFVKWSDEDTLAVRQVQIVSDTTFIAFFASSCGDGADLNVVRLYDWLLMLDVRAMRDSGYTFTEEDVTWYRIVGEIDSIYADYPDDEVVCKGYYLTLDKNLKGTGDYYCVVDVSNSVGVMCEGLMRSIIAHYASSTAPSRLALYPTHVTAGQQLKLVGLNPEKTTYIYIYDMVGKMLTYTSSEREATCLLTAMSTAGCYNVVVRCGDESQTLRYIVHH